MKKELLHDALNLLDDDMIEAVEALRGKKKGKINRQKWGSLAACFCVVVVAIAAVNHAGIFSGKGTGMEQSAEGALTTGNEAASSQAVAAIEAVTEREETGAEGIVIPKMEVDLNQSDGATMDMLALFFYQGRCYVEYERIENGIEFVGEKLGTIKGTFDEWNIKDGYVELAGSISGDFYAVDGYDQSFMLCMKNYDGSVTTFINNNDITVRTGADLFEDRFHLTGNYETVEYQTIDDVFGELIQLSEDEEEVIAKFVKAVNDAPFMLSKEIPLDEGERSRSDRLIYYMFFRMKDGMTVKLNLFKGGYVELRRFGYVCVQVDSDIFEQMIAVLESAG